ncbi:hypothetical protein ACWD6L_02885 [Micromonospora profundi]|uniref:hypothetical protein n=1 Tax=Micromonospora TaxID=1873 RepID=UPI0006AFA9E2|nr:hypothetical protein [Micromonospora sp. NRRL B-16802]KOX03220.1 hypothetical protein ADK66_28965 [Micromonospora sp. NRRL B-16802]
MISEPSHRESLPTVRRPLRRPPSIVASMSLLAFWWAYTIAVDVALLAHVGGAGNWLALAACTVAVAAVLRGLWSGGPTAWRVMHWFAAPVAAALLLGIGNLLRVGPLSGALRSGELDPGIAAAMACGLLALLALLAGGLLVRTSSARAWCGR